MIGKLPNNKCGLVASTTEALRCNTTSTVDNSLAGFNQAIPGILDAKRSDKCCPANSGFEMRDNFVGPQESERKRRPPDKPERQTRLIETKRNPAMATGHHHRRPQQAFCRCAALNIRRNTLDPLTIVPYAAGRIPRDSTYSTRWPAAARVSAVCCLLVHKRVIPISGGENNKIRHRASSRIQFDAISRNEEIAKAD